MNDKCVVLNAKKMNFDGKLDFSMLSSDVTVYDDTTKEQLSERIQGADIIVTKEMPVSGEMIQHFPESVKLICEAGTGYNNIDLEAARKKGITVCNIPAYSTERVAHTAIMMMLNLSSTMQVQMKMLARGNHDNFTKNLQVSHVEVNGKTLGVIGAGHIGRKVMQIAQALDMNILVHSRTPREDEKGIRYVSLEELLKNSDYVSTTLLLVPVFTIILKSLRIDFAVSSSRPITSRIAISSASFDPLLTTRVTVDSGATWLPSAGSTEITYPSATVSLKSSVVET